MYRLTAQEGVLKVEKIRIELLVGGYSIPAIPTQSTENEGWVGRARMPYPPTFVAFNPYNWLLTHPPPTVCMASPFLNPSFIYSQPKCRTKQTPSDFSLFPFHFSLEIQRISKRGPFALQNESFYPAKGVLLGCKTNPFGRQKESFWKIKVKQ